MTAEPQQLISEPQVLVQKLEDDGNIREVALPSADPIYGAGGPLMEYWAAH